MIGLIGIGRVTACSIGCWVIGLKGVRVTMMN